MIASKQIAFGRGAGKREYTAKDYVQDGLVAMWDGIENAGWGVYDESSTVWKDLVGASDLAIHGTWGEDYLNGYGNITFDIYKDLCNNRTLTLSFCSEVVDGGILFRAGTNSNDSWYTADGLPYKWLRIHRGLDNVASFIPPVGTIFSASIVIGESECTLWINGEKVKNLAYTSGNSSDVVASQFNVGGTRVNNTSKMRAFRMYNRAIKPEEVMYIYSIDKARFGL